jgi:hypothetical protein
MLAVHREVKPHPSYQLREEERVICRTNLP